MRVYLRTAVLLLGFATVLQADPLDLEYAPSPLDNPLRGMVPYLSAAEVDRFPHSMRFGYLSMAELVPAEGEYNWQPLDSVLEKCQSVGCQLILRVYLEYPGRSSGVPAWLRDKGVTVTEWTGEEGTVNHTPDYEHPALRTALTEFITAMGERYDRDPRLGFITAGLLGRWGEWHNYPREELFASVAVQREVLEAFELSFSDTPVLLRYPAGEDNPDKATTFDRSFGYHDDSFGWATLPTGRPEDAWHFLNLMEKAEALDTWKTHPIGGELRPELWKKAFTGEPHPKDQGFVLCVEATHASWLMDSSLFDPRFPLSPERKAIALKQVGRLGYEFHIAKVEWEGSRIRFHVENRGVAPFYRDWAVVTKGVDTEGGDVSTIEKKGLLPGILPGGKAIWAFEMGKPISEFEKILIGVPNPMEGGKSLRFGNREYEGEWIEFPISNTPDN